MTKRSKWRLLVDLGLVALFTIGVILLFAVVMLACDGTHERYKRLTPGADADRMLDVLSHGSGK